MTTQAKQIPKRASVKTWITAAPLALMLAAAGCAKKESAPDVQVAVQASHPAVGSIAEEITAVEEPAGLPDYI